MEVEKMRIWHKNLIPNLCRQHLLAVWREALGAYAIITEDKEGYSNHPAVKEFENCPEKLHDRLQVIREEATRRGYDFKELPERVEYGGELNEWQSLEKQKEVLQNKGCKCSV